MRLSLLGTWGRWKESATNPGITSEPFEICAWRPLMAGREIGIVYQNESDYRPDPLPTYWTSAAGLVAEAWLW